MKNCKKLLACVLAGVLALAVFTACSALIGASAYTSQEQGEALAKELSTRMGKTLSYSTELQTKAGRIASWVANSTSVRPSGDELMRVVPMGVGEENYGYWLSGDLNMFLFQSGCYAASESSLTIAFRTEATPLEQSALLYIPQQSGAAEFLEDYASGKTQMGVAFIKYGEVSYVVAVFR